MNDNIGSLFGLLERGSRLFPDKALYKYNKTTADKKEKTEESISYREFFDYTVTLATAFEELGLKEKRIMLVGDTSPMWVASFVAAVSVDAVAVPLDPFLLEDETIGFVNRAKATVVVCDEKYSDVFVSRMSECESLEKIIVIGETEGDLVPVCERVVPLRAVFEFGKALRENGKELTLTEADKTKMSILLFTSGTTGSSKGVMLSQSNMCAVINGAARLISGVKESDVMLSVLPVFHTYELTCGLLAPIYFGCTVCISDGIKYVSRNLKQFKPTVMFMVPLFAEHLHKSIMRTAKDKGKLGTLKKALSVSKALEKVGIDVRRKLFADVIDGLGGNLRHIVVGGAAMSPELSQELRALGIGVSQGYGITECAPLISVIPLDEFNPASCGRLMPEMQIFIDKENASDEFGEIVVKGPNVMLGYYEDEKATSEALHGGWFRTGDYGYVDKNGYLYITGRKKNVIVLSGGKNVFPEEIEEYLLKLPLVEEAVVAAMTDEKTGECIVGAYIYPSATECRDLGLVERDDICSRMAEDVKTLNKKLVGFKRIQKLVLRDEPFEKTSTKKVKRHLI